MRFLPRADLGLVVREDAGRANRAERAIYTFCLHHENIQSLEDFAKSGCHLCKLLKSSIEDTAASTPSIMSRFINFDLQSLYVSRQEGQYGSFNESHWHLDWHYEGRQYKMRMGSLKGISAAVALAGMPH
jgi:hypothetical protein